MKFIFKRSVDIDLLVFVFQTTDAVRPAAKIRILEVAVFITDKNYRRLDKGRTYIVHWPLTAEEITNEMPERCVA